MHFRMRLRITRTHVIVCGLIAATTFATTLTASGASISDFSSSIKYVALGDSFSSGEGAPAIVNGVRQYLPGTDVPGNRCHRSAAAYGPVASADRAIPRFEFHACSGAIIEDFFRPFSTNHPKDWRGGPANATELPQLNWLTHDTYVTMLTIGGNNAQFEDVMDYCAKRVIFERTCQSVWSGAVDSAINNLSIGTGHDIDNLPDLFGAIRSVAPGTLVEIVGYPRLFPKNPPLACWTGVPSPSANQPQFVRSDMRWINAEIAKLNGVIRTAAYAAGFNYVDVYDAFDGHEMCNGRQVEWLHRVVLGVTKRTQQQSYHPTVRGQAALAQLVEKSFG